jgi:hypothetical protein
LCLAAGCEEQRSPRVPAKQPSQPAAAKTATPPAPAQSQAAPANGAKPAPPLTPGEEVNQAVGVPLPAKDVIREKAEVGMGEAGRGYGEGLIATPVRALWLSKERLVLIQIQHAVDLFKAQEGRGPKSHDEFMDKIIKENAIRLPALPAGQRYVYDPAKQELQVERPRQ